MKSIGFQTVEVWENQRYYPIIGWSFGPDYPSFSDVNDNSAVKFNLPPNLNDPKCDWRVSYNPLTDDHEGWQYGLQFQGLNEQREGGRQHKRGSDMVRRRRWFKKPQNEAQENSKSYDNITADSKMRDLKNQQKEQLSQVSQIYARKDISEATQEQLAQQKFKEYSLTRGYNHFQKILQDLLRRNSLWDVITLDPLAWVFVNQNHAETLIKMKKLAEDKVYEAFNKQKQNNKSPQQQEDFIKQVFYAKTKNGGQIQRYVSEHRSLDFGIKDQSQDVLDMVIASVKYASASYGYVLQAGFLTNVSSFAQMQLGRTNFDPVGQASVEANNKAILKLTGINSKDLLMSEWHNSTFRPCHYVAVDNVRKLVVISIRGTLQMGDLYTDLAAKPMEVNIDGTDGYVHQGLLSAATYVHFNTIKALEKALERHSDYKVMVTGHSLGGGVAAILCLLLNQKHGAPEELQKNGIFCINHGAPPTMSISLSEKYKSIITSVVHRFDVVPSLSYLTFENLLKEVSEQAVGNKAMSGISTLFKNITETINQSSALNPQMNRSKSKQVQKDSLASLYKNLNQEGDMLIDKETKDKIVKDEESIEANKAISMLNQFYGSEKSDDDDVFDSSAIVKQKGTEQQQSRKNQQKDKIYQQQLSDLSNRNSPAPKDQVKSNDTIFEQISKTFNFTSTKPSEQQQIMRECLEGNQQTLTNNNTNSFRNNTNDLNQQLKTSQNMNHQKITDMNEQYQKEHPQEPQQQQQQVQQEDQEKFDAQQYSSDQGKAIKGSGQEQKGQVAQVVEKNGQQIDTQLGQSQTPGNDSVGQRQQLKTSPEKGKSAEGQNVKDTPIPEDRSVNLGAQTHTLRNDNKNNQSHNHDSVNSKFNYNNNNNKNSNKNGQNSDKDGKPHVSKFQSGLGDRPISADLKSLYKDLNTANSTIDLFEELQPYKTQLNEEEVEHMKGMEPGSDSNTPRAQGRTSQDRLKKHQDKTLHYLHCDVDFQNLSEDLHLAGRILWIVFDGNTDVWAQDQTLQQQKSQQELKKRAGNEDLTQKYIQLVDKIEKSNNTDNRSPNVNQQRQKDGDQVTPKAFNQSSKESSQTSLPSSANASQDLQDPPTTPNPPTQAGRWGGVPSDKLQGDNLRFDSKASSYDEDQFYEKDQNVLKQDMQQKLLIQQQLKAQSRTYDYLPPAAKAYLKSLDKGIGLGDQQKNEGNTQEKALDERTKKQIQDMYSTSSQHLIKAMQDPQNQNSQSLQAIQAQIKRNVEEQNNLQKGSFQNVMTQAQVSLQKQWNVLINGQQNSEWVALIEVDEQLFSKQILLHTGMVEDHFPSRYEYSAKFLK